MERWLHSSLRSSNRESGLGDPVPSSATMGRYECSNQCRLRTSIARTEADELLLSNKRSLKHPVLLSVLERQIAQRNLSQAGTGHMKHL